MAETEFKVFAQKLATYFQGNDSSEEFTRMLFEKIYLNPNGDSLLYDMETRTLRGYFYGEHDITTLAKKINKDLDSQYFEEFIDTETDDTIKGLCAAFTDECPGIDNENFKNKIAERFKESASVRKQQNLFLSLKKQQWMQQFRHLSKSNMELCLWRKNAVFVRMMAAAHRYL